MTKKNGSGTDSASSEKGGGQSGGKTSDTGTVAGNVTYGGVKSGTIRSPSAGNVPTNSSGPRGPGDKPK